jgi:peptidoglycan/LPS O-acetylase OafA/YrhL
LLKTRLIQFLGAISYPLYLIHPLGLILAIAILGNITWPNYGFQIIAYAVLSLFLAVPFARLLHVIVEVPAIQYRRSFSIRARSPSAPT